MGIGNIKISINNPTLIIPEIKINHNGKIDVACKIVFSTKRVGVKIKKIKITLQMTRTVLKQKNSARQFFKKYF